MKECPNCLGEGTTDIVELCECCYGSGVEEIECLTCNGEGEIDECDGTTECTVCLGVGHEEVQCEECFGSGEIDLEETCFECEGTGEVDSEDE